MQFFLIKMGMGGDVNQQEVMDLLKSTGHDVIQTSGGLCLKTDKNVDEIKTSNSKLQNLTFLKVQLHEESERLSDDVKEFMKKDLPEQRREVSGP